MKVTVISAQAIIGGREPVVWTGNVNIAEAINGSDDETPFSGTMNSLVNEHLFRYFNRVEDSDEERLRGVGYNLPSLSVGDIVYWNRKAWRVAGVGFEPIDQDTLARAVLFG